MSDDPFQDEDLWDFSLSESSESEEIESSPLKINFSKFAETDQSDDEFAPDAAARLVLSGQSYFDNGLRELSTVAQAITEADTKGLLDMLTYPDVSQGHAEILVAKETMFRKAEVGGKIESVNLDKLLEQLSGLMKVLAHQSIRGAVQTLKGETRGNLKRSFYELPPDKEHAAQGTFSTFLSGLTMTLSHIKVTVDLAVRLFSGVLSDPFVQPSWESLQRIGEKLNRQYMVFSRLLARKYGLYWLGRMRERVARTHRITCPQCQKRLKFIAKTHRHKYHVHCTECTSSHFIRLPT